MTFIDLILVRPAATIATAHFPAEKRKWKRVKSKGDRPTPRRSHNAFVFNNSMYVLLGYDGTANCEPDLFRYNFGPIISSVPFPLLILTLRVEALGD